MSDFTKFVGVGIFAAILGGTVGGWIAATGDFELGYLIIIFTSGVVALIILWGFALVMDEINENTERTADLLDLLTDKLEQEQGSPEE